MTRHIYLVIYSNGSRQAHQALFIPTKNTGSKGKVIHVTGNTATGFFLQFKRNYDFALEDRKYQVLLLAEVSHCSLQSQTLHDGCKSGDGNCHAICILFILIHLPLLQTV